MDLMVCDGDQPPAVVKNSQPRTRSSPDDRAQSESLSRRCALQSSRRRAPRGLGPPQQRRGRQGLSWVGERWGQNSAFSSRRVRRLE